MACARMRGGGGGVPHRAGVLGGGVDAWERGHLRVWIWVTHLHWQGCAAQEGEGVSPRTAIDDSCPWSRGPWVERFSLRAAFWGSNYRTLTRPGGRSVPGGGG